MIIVTGAAGFIGSCLVNKLNNKGFKDIYVVDDFSNDNKNKNLDKKSFIDRIDRNEFFSWFEKYHQDINFVFHLGARTDTTEFRTEIFDKLNLNYSKKLWSLCCKYNIPLVYASSAATYGMGESGYDDDLALIPSLKPLNPYGVSKNDFDKWVLLQTEQPPFWAGLKFFNVFGPNEYHKGRMASVVFHAFNQIQKTGGMKLFKSHNLQFAHGHQMRDFIYVKDVINICFHFLIDKKHSGIYNVGTGKARTFIDLARATFKAMNIPTNISFIDTPEDIRDKYQYFTEANMQKLHSIGYDIPFFTLEDAIDDYIKSYLSTGTYY